jgi:hypothetical protein
MSGENLSNTTYCGLYCGDCAFKRGTIPDLARDLRKELRDTRFDVVAQAIPFKEFEKYSDCYEVLGAMVRLRCNGCRGGSRSKFCEIAKCAIERGFEGCWECEEFAGCSRHGFLAPVHGDAHMKNLRKIKKVGVDEWAAGKRLWYSPPKKKRT